MKQYEYKSLVEASDSELNEMGLAGWRVISAEPVCGYRDRMDWNCLLVREIVNENGAPS